MSEIITEKTDRIIKTLAKELGTRAQYVANVVSLIDEGNTIPFIARYRKEMHGAMDDTALRTLAERLTYLRNLDERKDAVLKSIEEQGKLTEELKAAIEAASTQTEVEDLYRPYKQKKRTRATIAKEKGLEPLAFKILLQGRDKPETLAAEYVDPEKGVETIEDALAGASDIIAEMRGMGNYQRYSGDHARVLANRLEAAWKRERGCGNKIVFEANAWDCTTTKTKLSLVSMVDRGALTPNEWRATFNLAPVDGGDTPIRRLDTQPTTGGGETT